MDHPEMSSLCMVLVALGVVNISVGVIALVFDFIACAKKITRRNRQRRLDITRIVM